MNEKYCTDILELSSNNCVEKDVGEFDHLLFKFKTETLIVIFNLNLCLILGCGVSGDCDFHICKNDASNEEGFTCGKVVFFWFFWNCNILIKKSLFRTQTCSRPL